MRVRDGKVRAEDTIDAMDCVSSATHRVGRLRKHFQGVDIAALVTGCLHHWSLELSYLIVSRLVASLVPRGKNCTLG